MQHLEQEVKLDVDQDWQLPDLTGVLPGAQVVALPALSLEAVYFDTEDRRLEQQRITLRHRREREEPAAHEPGAEASGERTARVWTVKLASRANGAVLARTEVSWANGEGLPGEAGRRKAGDGGSGGAGAGAEAPSPPREAVELLAGVTLGEALRPLAALTTRRQRWHLRTSDGRALAEVAHDTVTGTRLSPLAGGTPATGPAHFTEVEVELATGSALEVVEAVVARLVEAGARPTSRQSKLMTVLRSLPGPNGRERTGPDGPEGPRPEARSVPAATVGDVLAQQAQRCLRALVKHDPPIRLGDPSPEHVHRSRVATRRLRTLLRAVQPLLPGAETGGEATTSGAERGSAAWLSALRDQMRWLGRMLGTTRDADVRLHWGEQACATLSPADEAGASSVMAQARRGQEIAHQELLDAMRSERYIQALRLLEALGRPGGTGEPAELRRRLRQPAAPSLAGSGREQWASLAKAVARLGDDPPEAALHKLRIKAKRLRYLAEVAAPVLTPPSLRSAERTVRAAAALQDVLGELHDSAVNEQWLRGPVVTGAANEAAGVGTTIVAGQLIAMARQVGHAQRAEWGHAWGRLDRKKLRRWTAGPPSG
ncbi:MAG: CHAD domain-containing protein [Acidimicrobiales bacterium]